MIGTLAIGKVTDATNIPTLDVSGSSNGGTGTLRVTNTNTGTREVLVLKRASGGGGTSFVLDDTAATGGRKWEFFTTDSGNSEGAGKLLIYNNNVNNLAIDSAGNVGIGITAPNYTMHVNGSVAGTSAYNDLSDMRLKKDVHPITGALGKVMSLQGVTFNWDRSVNPLLSLDNQNHLGFIAQDVEKVLPQAVSTANDAMHTKSVAYSTVVPVLSEAIKELKGENDRLKAEVEELKAQLKKIQDLLGQR